MRVSNVEFGAAGGAPPAPAGVADDPVRRFVEMLPRPFRFLGVGGLGLIVDGARESYTARHVVSSAPLRDLVERIKPVPISLLHARALRYRDFLTVALMVRKDELFPDNWIYIHDSTVNVGRAQNFRSWSPQMVPAGMSCLGLEYFCFEGDGLWNAPDRGLIALAKQEAAQIGLVAKSSGLGGSSARVSIASQDSPLIAAIRLTEAVLYRVIGRAPIPGVPPTIVGRTRVVVVIAVIPVTMVPRPGADMDARRVEIKTLSRDRGVG